MKSKAKVVYVPKSKLSPAFGQANMGKQIAYVRKDLPKPVKEFVKIHEIYHLNDKSKNWLVREIKANIYAGMRKPWGLIVTILKSLTLERLRLYKKRFKDKK